MMRTYLFHVPQRGRVVLSFGDCYCVLHQQQVRRDIYGDCCVSMMRTYLFHAPQRQGVARSRVCGWWPEQVNPLHKRGGDPEVLVGKSAIKMKKTKILKSLSASLLPRYTSFSFLAGWSRGQTKGLRRVEPASTSRRSTRRRQPRDRRGRRRRKTSSRPPSSSPASSSPPRGDSAEAPPQKQRRPPTETGPRAGRERTGGWKGAVTGARRRTVREGTRRGGRVRTGKGRTRWR